MTRQEFITAIEAKSTFIKWAEAPALQETIGDIEKWRGSAFVITDDGRNVVNVWFVVDTATGEAFWQNSDTLEPEANTFATKQAFLEKYLKTNFNAYFVNRSDLANNWAEADVYTLTAGNLVKKTVMVYKIGNNPIAHKDVITA